MPLTTLDMPAHGVDAMTRDERREYLLAAAHELAATRFEGVQRLAEMLHVSRSAVDSWLKPASSESSRPAPAWAVELYALKRQGPRLRVFERLGGGHVAVAES